MAKFLEVFLRKREIIPVDTGYRECFNCGGLFHKWKLKGKEYIHHPKGPRVKKTDPQMRIKYWCSHCEYGSSFEGRGVGRSYSLLGEKCQSISSHGVAYAGTES